MPSSGSPGVLGGRFFLSDFFLLTANSISSCLFVGWNDSHPNGPRIKKDHQQTPVFRRRF